MPFLLGPWEVMLFGLVPETVVATYLGSSWYKGRRSRPAHPPFVFLSDPSYVPRPLRSPYISSETAFLWRGSTLPGLPRTPAAQHCSFLI